MTDEMRLALLQAKAILMKLKAISDAPTHASYENTVQFEHSTRTMGLRTRERHGMKAHHGNYREGQVPEGASLAVRIPSKERSLYEHFLARMKRAQENADPTRLLVLVVEAQRDYERYTGRKPVRHYATDGDAVEVLLTEYSGTSCAEAAVWMDAPRRWVREQRVLNGKDPDDGTDRADDPRTDRIVAMRKAGATTRVIAAEVGVSHVQIQRILAGA